MFDKAAALWHGLANNHGFQDGNKRTATHSMLCFLGVNDISLEYSQKELSNMAVLVGSGNSKINRQEISDWIKKGLIKISSIAFCVK
ncbi:type II toxin-antitoxin system death-on-curing family toxin [Pectinatus frisingensis]|uniref:type II toxin-antitoxin system death-on-curing family toxin n=1 Tax=Pectinatus frisingensis TaxID=865 RepID=UPI0039BF1C20